MALPINLLITVLLFLVLPIVLEVFLARAESPIPGLILPVLSGMVSVLFILYMAIPGEGGAALAGSMIALPVLNIPTLVLLAIYFTCRSGKKRKNQMDKMNIQDL